MAVAMASSFTLLSAEIEGRAYGGGVLKVETREAGTGLVFPRLVQSVLAELETAHPGGPTLMFVPGTSRMPRSSPTRSWALTTPRYGMRMPYFEIGA